MIRGTANEWSTPIGPELAHHMGAHARYHPGMDVATRNELIARYRAGYGEVRGALAGIAPAELDRPAADGWTARQVVHHLADSEWTSGLRLRKLLAEPVPILCAYPEEAWARALFYDRRPIEPSLEAFRLARETTLGILEHMTEDGWKREGWHSESGLYTPERWLEIYAAHAFEHAAQIRRARGG